MSQLLHHPASAAAQRLLAAAQAPAPLGGQQLVAALLTTQFAYVLDHPTQTLVFVSDGVESLLGERPDAATLGPGWLAQRLHPADAAPVAEAQVLVGAYLREHAYAPLPDFLFSLDYRLRRADGSYCRVLHQHLLLEREPGPSPVRRSLHLLTDLSRHKFTHEVGCHVNQPDFAAWAARQRAAPPALTPREQQVLRLVLEGLTSRQIAYRLHLREATVLAHRRNIRRKTGTRSLHGLLGFLPPPPGPP